MFSSQQCWCPADVYLWRRRSWTLIGCDIVSWNKMLSNVDSISVCACVWVFVRKSLSPSVCVRWGCLVKGPSALVSAHQSSCQHRHCSGRLNSLWQGPLKCRVPPNINNTGTALAYDSLRVEFLSSAASFYLFNVIQIFQSFLLLLKYMMSFALNQSVVIKKT